MSRDYAKKSSSTRKKAPARKPHAAQSRSSGSPPPSGWRWYTAGLLSGVFLSFLLYLGTLPGGKMTDSSAEQGGGTAPQEPPKPRFDFYTMLPEQTIEIEQPQRQPNRNAPTTAASQAYYLLQAGSFRQREDADRRRAELLLLGLEPTVEEATGENGRWFRVYLGPFQSRSKMSKARSLTAAQNIDTLLLKRNG